MAALSKNSTFLSTITDDFRQMLEDFQIISFYETRRLAPFGIVSIAPWWITKAARDLILSSGCR